METVSSDTSKLDLEWDDGHVLPEKIYPDVAHLFRRMNEITVEKVAVKGGELVLDVGCGRATDAVEVAKTGGRCLGLEPSSTMINHARQHIADNGQDVRLAQGAGEQLPFKDNTFDRVFCKGALDHFPHPAKAIEEMARVLKPQGKVIIAVANFESLGFRLGLLMFKLEKVIFRGKSKHQNLWQIPDDHTIRLDYKVLKRLVKPHLIIEQSTGLSLLMGLPGWSLLLDRLPENISTAILKAMDKLASGLPSLSNVIIIRCRPRD